MIYAAAPHMSPEEFRAHGRRVVDWIAQYWEKLPDRGGCAGKLERI